MKLFVGVDTSCYTSSVAMMTEDGTLVADVRKPLLVKPGGRGLAQSEMVFQHTRNLPELFAAAMQLVPDGAQIAGIAASVQPRPHEESYMPAFVVGSGFAKAIAASLRVPFCSLSHQETHIMAGVWSADGPAGNHYLALHVSGGTTEITRIDAVGLDLSLELLGGSRDIAAGQLVDRIGVALGLGFPAGPHLEALARTAKDAIVLPVAVDGIMASFSGPEAQAKRLLAQGTAPAAIAAGIQGCIAQSLISLATEAIRRTGITDLLFVGGVMANQKIRSQVTDALCRSGNVRLYFPRAEFSSDNAVGAAYFALKIVTR